MNELEEDDSYSKQPGKTVFGNSSSGNSSVQGGDKPAPVGFKAKFFDAIGWYENFTSIDNFIHSFDFTIIRFVDF